MTGSPDFLRAAAYVVRKFRSYGLEPAGVGGSYYQPVHFIEQWVEAGKSSLNLVVDGQTQPLALGQDAVLSSRSPEPATVDAGLVFLGMVCICRIRTMTTSIRPKCRRDRCGARLLS